MSCCGNKRAAYTSGQTSAGASRPRTPVSEKMWTDLHFANTGDTPLMVTGSITGRIYRWAGKGDIQVVDYRDAGALRYQWKVLRRVMPPH